jgi:hypothetical protein
VFWLPSPCRRSFEIFPLSNLGLLGLVAVRVWCGLSVRFAITGCRKRGKHCSSPSSRSIPFGDHRAGGPETGRQNCGGLETVLTGPSPRTGAFVGPAAAVVNPGFRGLPGSTPSASFGLSFACATNQINNLQQER